ncbi:hypothetical protein JL100_017960 [Skermanella mucosa]|uniref:hypothetical protein n=1 Tax=Skermanella mucosa TaxID=1789672 RepID=UPI00192C5D71|nr:hypothetical protein [Skermanella mucosa]UEM18971.1 hypothetical protein JL100_017960 [Skermanella mucosa]
MSRLYQAKAKAKLDGLVPRGLGVQITHIRKAVIFDPATQTATTTDLSQKASASIKTHEVRNDDGTIRSVQRVFLCDAAGLKTAPVAGDIIRHAGTDYTITAVETLAPGGVPILHRIFVNS